MKWLKNINILSSLRLMLMLLAVVFVLSACSDSNSSAENTVSPKEGSGTSISEHKSAGCWQGEILTTIYDAIGMTAMHMFNKLTKGAMNVMLMAFSVWLAFRLLKFLSSFTEENAGEIWNEIIRKAAVCLFCGYLASSSGMALTVVNNLLFPIYNSFLEFGDSIMTTATATTKYDLDNIKAFGEEVNAKKYPLKCSSQGSKEASLEGFPKSTESMMRCMLCALSSRLTFGMTLSFAIMDSNPPTSFVSGFILLASFVVVYLGFAFYLVDSVFKFGVMILLLPLLILSYAFEATRDWTKKGFANIMESAVFMMAICLILTMAIVAIISIINKEQIKVIFNASQADFADGSIPMICLLLIAFLVSGSLGVSAQITGSLIGTKVSTKFQEKLKAVASMVLNWATGGIGGKIKAAFGSTKIGRTANKTRAKLNQLAGKG